MLATACCTAVASFFPLQARTLAARIQQGSESRRPRRQQQRLCQRRATALEHMHAQIGRFAAHAFQQEAQRRRRGLVLRTRRAKNKKQFVAGMRRNLQAAQMRAARIG
jgi:hypothetical protein